MTVNDGKQILSLEGCVTIRNARELGICVSNSLEANLPVEVETQQLTDIDTCVLQFLLSAPQVGFAVKFSQSFRGFVSGFGA